MNKRIELDGSIETDLKWLIQNKGISPVRNDYKYILSDKEYKRLYDIYFDLIIYD